MTKPILPSPPPPTRYADPSTYGFYLEFVANPKPIDQIAAAAFVVGGVLGSASAAVKDYVELNLNPQQITFEEPAATSITYTQGGGKFVESRGGLVKTVVIQGTTGFLPTGTQANLSSDSSAGSVRYTGGLVDTSSAAENARANRSGWAAFHDLRYLFRRFFHERRLGTDVLMHYMDFASDEFWIIEPQSFIARQNARRRTLRDYEIRFTCLEPSGASSKSPLSLASTFQSAVASALRDMPVAVDPRKVSGTTPDRLISPFLDSGSSFDSDVLTGVVATATTQAPALRTMVSRFKTQIDDGRSALSFVVGEERRAISHVLDTMSDVVSVFDDLDGFILDAAATPAVLLGSLDDAITTAFDVMGTVHTPEELSAGIEAEWNEFLLEVRLLVDFARAAFADDSRSSFVNRTSSDIQNFATSRTSGSANDLIPESGRPLEVNPFIPLRGLEGVVDTQRLAATDSFQSVPIHYGESVYDLARRTLGNVHRFVELVLLNDLEFPFIVASLSDKPPGTLAWGEYIKIPTQSQSDLDAAVGPGSPPVAVFGGRVSITGTSTELIDADKLDPWRINQWVGYTVEMKSGSATVDGVRLVVSNTEDTLVVHRPWTTFPTIGDTFTISLQEFTLRIPPSPEQIAFGSDLLLRWNQKKGSLPNPFVANIVRDSRGDLARIRGMENYVQAIMILFATPRGSHIFHPRYGVGLPIGRPFNGATAPLYNFFVRQALLDDPRTEAVGRSLLSFEGGAYSYQAEVKPVNVHKAKQVNLLVGR